MDPIERPGRGRKQLDHENRIETLERRIPVDYPYHYSILLGDTGAVGPGSYSLGFTFGDDCSDPTGLECEGTFTTSGDYLFLPSGFGGVYIVTINAALQSGAADNYLTPVTLGDITPTNLVKPGFTAYIATDNVVDTGSFTVAQEFIMNTQEPPAFRGGGYARLWSQYRIMGANSFLNQDNTRWALRPFVQILAPIVSINISGLAMSVTLLPPGGVYGGATWSG